MLISILIHGSFCSDVDCYKSTDCSNTIGRESFYENLAFEQDKKE